MGNSNADSDFDQLLDLVPGLRRRRDLNADMVRSLLDRRRGECTWCGSDLPRGRTRWCSDDCIEYFRLRCDTIHQRSVVLRRDKGLCCDCGRDVVGAKKKAQKEVGSSNGFSSKHRELVKTVWGRHGFARGNWFEVDHIVPVSCGGGLMGPDNLRLLCSTCHSSRTIELAKKEKR